MSRHEDRDRDDRRLREERRPRDERDRGDERRREDPRAERRREPDRDAGGERGDREDRRRRGGGGGSRSRSRERRDRELERNRRDRKRSRSRGGSRERRRSRSGDRRRARKSRSKSPPRLQQDGKRRRGDGFTYSAEPHDWHEAGAPPPPLPMEEDPNADHTIYAGDAPPAPADGGAGGGGAHHAAAMEADGDAGEGGEAGEGLALDAELTPEEIMMMQQMGIPFGFDSSQGKKHTDAGAVKVKTTRGARQYMNRRGGFNRSLDGEATGEKVRIEWLRT